MVLNSVPKIHSTITAQLGNDKSELGSGLTQALAQAPSSATQH